MEEAKLRASTEKFPDLLPHKNLSVSGRPGLTFPEVLERAEKEHGHLTTEELRDMRMRHGHGVASRY